MNVPLAIAKLKAMRMNQTLGISRDSSVLSLVNAKHTIEDIDKVLMYLDDGKEDATFIKALQKACDACNATGETEGAKCDRCNGDGYITVINVPGR